LYITDGCFTENSIGKEERDEEKLDVVMSFMAPQEDGTVPDTPYRFTSIYRELMSYCDSDDRQLIDSATMIKSGPRCGYCLLNFRQTEECEEFAVKFASNPCAMLRLLSLNVKGFREDMVINLCKSFDPAARGRALRFIWDSDTWSAVPIDDDDIDHDFLDDLQKDGYILTDHMKENRGTGNIVEVSRIVADSDIELLKQMGVASDDITLGTKHGKSVIGDCNSVATQNTQQRRRTMDEKCIADALAQEEAAARKWKDIASAATSATGLNSPSPSNVNPQPSPLESPTVDPSNNPNNPPTTPPSSANPQGVPSPPLPKNHPNTSVSPNGVPASTKQSGPGNNTSPDVNGEAAVGPQGHQ
jgi:hypothetical protein